MQKLIAAALAVLVFLSALQIVVTRHQSRKLFSELQQLELNRDAMTVEWGRLQLEEATWGTHGRVEELARDKLGLTQPALDAIVLVMP